MREKDIHYLIENQNLEEKQRVWEKAIKKMPEINRQITDSKIKLSKKERLKCNKEKK